MANQYDQVVVTFAPTMKCSMHEDCDTLTTWAQVRISDPQDLQFSPACPLHGLAWECPTSDTYQSVERFVMSTQDWRGTAKVIGEVSLASVPNYEPVEDASFSDTAWQVLYVDQGGAAHLVAVTWSPDLLEFTSYRYGRAAQ